MKIRPSHILDLAQLLAVIAVLAAALFLSSQLRAKNSQTTTAKVRTAPVVSLVSGSELTYTPTVSLTGSVVARTSTEVAARVAGQVVAVSDAFRAGANVRAGEVLFSIDPDDYVLQVERARADIANAQASLARVRAESDSARQEWERLYPGRPITSLAALRPQLRAAEAQLSGARAAAKTARLALERTRVVAPVDAYVVSTGLDVGQILSPAQPVGVLQPLDAIEVEASLSVSELATLSPVTDRACVLRFASHAADDEMAGRLVRVAPRLDPLTRLARVYIALSAPETVRVGEFADIEIIGEPVANALRLEQTSLSATDRVWVVDDGVLASRGVTVLAREPEVIVASFGIADGVVSVPPFGAYEGMRVQVAGQSRSDVLAN